MPIGVVRPLDEPELMIGQIVVNVSGFGPLRPSVGSVPSAKTADLLGARNPDGSPYGHPVHVGDLYVSPACA